MKILWLISLISTVISVSADSYAFGKCQPTQEFTDSFTKYITKAFDGLADSEINNLEPKEKQLRFGDAMQMMMIEWNLMDSNLVLYKAGWLNRLNDMMIIDQNTKCKLEFGFEACFCGFKGTREETFPVWMCMANVKDILCDVPYPQMCHSIQQPTSYFRILNESVGRNVQDTHNDATTKSFRKEESRESHRADFERKFEPHQRSHCSLPENIAQQAFQCLIQKSNSNGLNKESVNSFFKAIKTDELSKKKLKEDVNKCLAKPETHDSHLACLYNAYKETCKEFLGGIVGRKRYPDLNKPKHQFKKPRKFNGNKTKATNTNQEGKRNEVFNRNGLTHSNKSQDLKYV